MGWDNIIDTATCYRLDVQGSNPRGGEISTHPGRPWGPPSLLYNGYQIISGGKVAQAWHWQSTPI